MLAAEAHSCNYVAVSCTTTYLTICGNIVVGNGNGIEFSDTANTGNRSSELRGHYEGATWAQVYFEV